MVERTRRHGPPPTGPKGPVLDRRAFLLGAGALAALPRPASGAATDYRTAPAGYAGMDDGASWRREALGRIEQLRKGDFLLQVTDHAGRALPGIELRASQERHHFGFGGAVQARMLFEEGSGERQQFYRETAAQLFHRITIANELKWKHYEAQRHNAELCLAWCAEQDLPVRGHCLVWPRFRRIPDGLHRLRDDLPALRRAIEQRVVEMVSRYGPPLVEWDVLNEPFTEHEFMDLLGPGAAHDWFRLAERANPRLGRWINDFGVLTRPSAAHQDFYFEYVRGLLQAGVPVQGIGFQGHVPRAFAPTPPQELFATMDRFATLGLPLQVTEFDFETSDEDLQARYTQDFLVAVFSHPAMVGLVTWTPFEYAAGEGSKPDAAFFDHALREKPNGRAWHELVNGSWRTQTQLVTDARGVARFRGFYGTYAVEASNGSAGAPLRIGLLPGATQLTITL